MLFLDEKLILSSRLQLLKFALSLAMCIYVLPAPSAANLINKIKEDVRARIYQLKLF